MYSNPIDLTHAVTREEFNKVAKQLPSHIVIDNPKYYNKDTRTVRLYRSEYQEGKVHFFWFQKKMMMMVDMFPTFKKIGSGDVALIQLNNRTFAPVTQEVIRSLLASVPQQEAKVVPLNSLKLTDPGYEQLVDDVLERTRKQLITKGLEYHRDNNAYHNFDRIGLMNNQLPERALWGLMSKQITSCLDIIEDLEKGIYPSVELIEEKCGDVRNYAINLEGLLKRTISNQQENRKAA